MSLRLEALHDPLSSPDRLMGILRPIVLPFVRTVLDAGHDLPLRPLIGSKLIGDHDARGRTLLFQKLAHQPLCSLGITAALDQNIENEAVLIDGAPEPVSLSPDGDNGLVEVPFVAELSG